MRSTFKLGAVMVVSALVAVTAAGCTTEAFCFDDCDGSAAAAAGSGGAAAGKAGAGGGSGGFVSGGNGGTGGFAGTGGGGTAGKSGAAGNCTANTQTDPANCGACGNKCVISGAFAKCVAGKCAIDSCSPGRSDLNKDPTDGCEYACVPTTPATEVCDGKDNDCNGKVDDGFDFQTDPKNCGACGVSCTAALPNTLEAGCVKGTCTITKCAAGFGDADKVASDGCEYKCPSNPPKAEECNGLDDDCDGNVDNGNPGGGQPCTAPCPGGVCQGECKPGQQQCLGNGTFACFGGQGPSFEICDGKDNDCNGVVDDGFDVQTDPKNCGKCGTACTFGNAIGSCTAGACTLSECLAGYYDLDKKADNGCEYKCPQIVPGAEICDGIDNDCDGLVDDKDPDLIVPGNFCNTTAGTPCATTKAVCMGAMGLRCSYGADVEVDAMGNILPSETKCDGKDGNCDGLVDESYPLAGKSCNDGGIGVCAAQGTYTCNATGDATECTITAPGKPPGPELCNGQDDDCNGAVDDSLPTTAFDMVDGGGFFVDRFEASRPDATATSSGTLSTVACSTGGVFPWNGPAHALAKQACEARGANYRLCTAAELGSVCASAANNTYPYGNTFAAATCNGEDNLNALTATGSLAMCKTASGVFDLSGNLSEWTSTKTGTTQTVPNYDIYQLHGGGYESPPLGMSCVISLAPRAAENAILASVGFRCCRNP